MPSRDAHVMSASTGVRALALRYSTAAIMAVKSSSIICSGMGNPHVDCNFERRRAFVLAMMHGCFLLVLHPARPQAGYQASTTKVPGNLPC